MTQQPSSHWLRSAARGIWTTLFWSTSISIAIYLLLTILTLTGNGIERQWSPLGTDFAIAAIAFCIMGFAGALTIVSWWAIELPDQARLEIARTTAVGSAAWLFIEHTAYGRLESITAPVFAMFWSAAIAVRATPLIDRIAARWKSAHVWSIVYSALFASAAAQQVAAQYAWGYGVPRFSKPIATMASGEAALALACLIAAPVSTIGLLWWLFHQPARQEPEHLRLIVTGKRPDGLPQLTWTQHAGTLDTVARLDARGRFKFYLIIVAGGTLMGLPNGPGGMLFGFMLTALIGSFGLRGADKPVMQGDTLRLSPHTKTDEERLEESEPVTHYEICLAYLEVADDVIWFCVERGDYYTGQTSVVERVPWQSIGNFEEGSHKEWFRSRVDKRDVRDWGVIIAQSAVGRVLRVAESVDDRAWLIELLIKLQNMFIEPREAMLQAVAEAAAAKSIGPPPTEGVAPVKPASIESVPTRRF